MEGFRNFAEKILSSCHPKNPNSDSEYQCTFYVHFLLCSFNFPRNFAS
jgi:hypothetical protein